MSAEITPGAMEAFLKELTELSAKYRLTIGGCGCCSSPWVEAMLPKEEGGKYILTKYDKSLEWVKP